MKHPVVNIKAKRTKAGQTVIEFALVSVLFIFMLVLTFNAILAFTTQQYMSYVAFMTARAFQAGGDDVNSQFTAAANTVANYIPGFSPSMVNSGVNLPITFPSFGTKRVVAIIKRVYVPKPQAGDYSSSSGLSGVGETAPQDSKVVASLPKAIQIDFTAPLAAGMPLGQEVAQKLGFINMHAQSFLGRQVSNQECRTFFENFLDNFIYTNANANAAKFHGFSKYMEDNGC